MLDQVPLSLTLDESLPALFQISADLRISEDVLLGLGCMMDYDIRLAQAEGCVIQDSVHVPVLDDPRPLFLPTPLTTGNYNSLNNVVERPSLEACSDPLQKSQTKAPPSLLLLLPFLPLFRKPPRSFALV